MKCSVEKPHCTQLSRDWRQKGPSSCSIVLFLSKLPMIHLSEADQNGKEYSELWYWINTVCNYWAALPMLITQKNFLPWPKGFMAHVNSGPVLSFSQWVLQEEGRRWYLFSHSGSPRVLAAAWVPVARRVRYVSFEPYELICWFFCQKGCSKDTWNRSW